MTEQSARARISTIIPCYNGERYLAEAIESVLRQTLPAAEVIVVDDGSSDGSAAVAARFDGSVVTRRQAHAGISAARNHGVAAAAGALITFLDADDLWPEDRLRQMTAALENDPSLAIVFGRARQFVSPELSEEAKARLQVPPTDLTAHSAGGLLARREVFDRVGPFATEFTTGGDMDWILRATDLGVKVATIPQLVLMRRLHLSNHGIVRRDARPDYARVVKAALDRRRDLRKGHSGTGTSDAR